MPTKLIKLSDNTLVEVEIIENRVEQISGSIADKVDGNLKNIKPLIINASEPIAEAIKELENKSKIESIEAEISLGFEGEGNLYITKAKATANIVLKLKFKAGS
ncbi:MAG: CU044_2847 family protein [Thiothrix sp.]|uniref:CU044_2847 family protein n=1 Tax=Thiothrix sp. TaxID=1032 RepID=UPI00262074C2|nr:CU044_2847 family protein [Thiothrix sp.]MDD5393065.1 CU044_2847 family protein [Thiothrix sp.]